MKIPKTVKVGGLIYKVEIVDKMDDDSCVAKTYFQELTIRIGKAEKDFMEQAFIHELLHTINGELKETDVEFFAMSLYQVLKDNSDIFEKEVTK